MKMISRNKAEKLIKISAECEKHNFQRSREG